MEGKKAGKDNSIGRMPFHGTCTADKALGAQYGAAKKATLTTVVMARAMLAEILSAFSQIATDLRDHPERRKFVQRRHYVSERTNRKLRTSFNEIPAQHHRICHENGRACCCHCRKQRHATWT